jgi:Tfp pilus assembly protein PilN
VLHATLTDGEWHYRIVEVARTKSGFRITETNRTQQEVKKRKFPVVLVLSGQGIVDKSYPTGDPALQRIAARPEEFLFAQEDRGETQRLTFMRREQYEQALAGCSAVRGAVIGVRIDPQGDMEAEALAAGREFFDDALSFRQLKKASPENNTLFSLLTGRLLLPVLGMVLIALTVNFFVRKGLEEEREQQQFLLGRLQQNAAAREQEEGGQRRLQELLLPQARHPYAWIADRIAVVIPEGVVLTELTVHPLQAKLQVDKPARTDAGRVVIRGESSGAASVTRLTDTLSRSEVHRSVQLISLSRGRDGNYLFEIDLRL